MVLKLYNTLTNKKEKFKPQEGNKVRMYICGQTVYDYMHIGHGKTYIIFDIIKRYLEYKGYNVELVINITDINDKILNKAEKENKEYWEIVEKFTKINLEDFEDLKIQGDVYPKASDYLQEMIEVIEGLINKGYAYEVEGDVFFNVRKFEDYGKLSNQNLGDIAPQRDDIIASEKKKHPEDFVLWRKKDVKPRWDSPWSKGWPGWHIECSTMSTNILGDTLDIHGGGSDLIFPHHEDEIAQSEGYTEKKFSKYWLHSGLVNLKEKKMSKSEGNIISTRELLEEYDPEVLRLMVASSHYRKEMSFSKEKLEENKNKLQRLRNTISDLETGIRESEKIPEKYQKKDLKTLEKIYDSRIKFIKAMNDDFNTPKALKQLFKLSSTLQSYLNSENTKKTVLQQGLKVLRKLGGIFGILEEKKDEIPIEMENIINLLINIREELREEGKYELSDSIRSKLKKMGIILEDQEKNTKWKYKS